MYESTRLDIRAREQVDSVGAGEGLSASEGGTRGHQAWRTCALGVVYVGMSYNGKRARVRCTATRGAAYTRVDGVRALNR